MSVRTHNLILTLSLLAACIWAAFIWHWSSQPGSASPLRGEISPSYYDHLAHFCVFGMLAVFVWIVLKLTTDVPAAGTFSICFTYGIIDEIHQTIAGYGRLFSMSDLLFDALGILVAIAVLSIAARLWRILVTS